MYRDEKWSGRPPRPADLISRDKRWKIVPVVSVFSMNPLPAISVAQEEMVKREGPLYRIVYCRRTYDWAMKEADNLVAKGVRPTRIEYVYAERDEVAAIKRGDFEVVPLVDGDEANGE